MNIIQIQDRLKGMPKSAIIDYVQNPTGEVPSFLALAELQRRKDADEKYQAMQEPPASVAEQIVAENMPMGQGLGGMATPPATPETGMGTPQPQPEMTPDMAAQSGVGALPAGNVGQNYAGGGIIAFEEGGEVEDDYGLKEAGEDLAVEAGLMRLFGGVPGMLMTPGEAKASSRYSDEEFAKKLGYADGGSVLRKIPKVGKVLDAGKKFIEGSGAGKIDDAIYSGIAKTSRGLQKGVTGLAKGIYNNPFATSLGGVGLGTYLMSGESDEEKALRELEEANKASKEMHKQARKQNTSGPKKETTPAKTMSDYRQEFMDMLGEDTTRSEMRERMAKLDEKAAKREAQAPWLATMQAGLAMAAGSSPYALQNIAVGAAEGIRKYGDEQEAMQAIEEKRLALLDDMARAERAEKVAAIEYGMQSKQFEESQALKQSIANQESTLKFMTSQLTRDKDRAKVAEDIIGAGEMQAWTKQFLADNGEDYANSTEFHNAYQKELGRRINERMRAGTSGQLFDTTEFLDLGV